MSIIIEGSEKVSHTLKGDLELLKKYDVNWKTVFITRCPRCNRLFISKTEKKYCSKECQYNRRQSKEGNN